MTLAGRLDEFSKSWDIYDYRNSDCSVAYFEELLKSNPNVIIEELLNIIEEMED